MYEFYDTYWVLELIKYIPHANNHSLLSDSLMPTYSPPVSVPGSPSLTALLQTLGNPPWGLMAQGQGSETLLSAVYGAPTVFRAAGNERSRENVHISHGDRGHAAQRW